MKIFELELPNFTNPSRNKNIKLHSKIQCVNGGGNLEHTLKTNFTNLTYI